MIQVKPSPTNWVAIGIIVTAVLGIATWFVVHALTGRRERLRDQLAAEQSRKARRRELLNIAIEIRARMTDKGDDMGRWVFHIKEDILFLKTGFDKIAHELIGDDKVRMQAAIDGVMEFSGMEHGDIYEHGQELLDALNKFPDD
jgi:HAMP domain-containing protein